MTNAEFTDWFRHHLANFPSVIGWLTKFPTKPRHECDPTQADIRDRWEKCLADVSLAEAQAATDALFRGDEPLPRIFDEHPQTVRRLAFRSRNASREASYDHGVYVDGEPTVRCRDCSDVGLVTCYHRKTVKAMRTGKLRLEQDDKQRYFVGPPFSWYTVCVVCHCASGDRYAKQRDDVQRYSEERFCAVRKLRTEDRFHELRDWCDGVPAGPMKTNFDADAWVK